MMGYNLLRCSPRTVSSPNCFCTVIRAHCKSIVVTVAAMTAIFTLALLSWTDRDESDSARYIYGRPRLKSSGTHARQHYDQTADEESRYWLSSKDLENILPNAVYDQPFPKTFLACQPDRVLQYLEANRNLDSYTYCNKVLYNRVPKCGSRTVVSVMKVLAEQNNFTLERRTKLEGNRAFYKNITDLIGFGHEFSQMEEPFIFTQHLHFVNFTQMRVPPPMYINVVRDPVERVISHYYFNRFGSYSAPKEIIKNMTIDECIRNRHNCSAMPTHHLLPYFCGQAKFCRTASEESLHVAKRTSRIAYLTVGLTEDLPAFFEVLETLLPQFFKNSTAIYEDLEVYSRNRTMTVKKPDVEPETIAYLKDILGLEYDFYRHAQQRFYSLLAKVRALKDENAAFPNDIQENQLLVYPKRKERSTSLQNVHQTYR